MTIDVSCGECGHVMDAPDSLAGGISNCERCGQAVEVPGLRDPFYRLLQAGAAVAWAGITAVVYAEAGLTPAAYTALFVAFLIWLISRAF